jgi:hypothetical protein
MASIQPRDGGGYYYPECPHADNEDVYIRNCKCKALSNHTGAASGVYWCGVAQDFDRCPFDREV